MSPHVRRPRALPALVSALLVLSCGDNGSGPPPVATVTVSPASVSLTYIGETRSLTATARDDAGNPLQVTVSWTSSNPSAVEVSSDGTVTARASGTSTVTATAGGVASTPVAVAVDQQVTGVDIDQTSLSFSSLGETQTVTASAVDQGGTPVAGISVTWVTTNDQVVTVNAAGLVTAVGNGNASIRATAGQVNASVSVMVRQVAVSAQRNSPSAVAFASLGETAQIEIEARDAMGRFIDQPSGTFTPSDGTVVSVSTTGLITALANGDATISILVDDVALDPVEVTVEQVIASIQVDPDLLVLNSIGETQDVTGTALDARGNAVADVSFDWTSSDAAIASVEPSGSTVTVTAVAGGIATVQAEKDAMASDPVEVFVGSGEVTALASGDRITGLLGPAGFQRFYSITVPAGAGELHVGTGGGTSFSGSGPGDLDLFLRRGGPPTNDFNDAGQFNSGQPANDEFIEVLDPQAGDWYILVDGFADGPGYRDVTLTAEVEVGPPAFHIRLEYISDFTAQEKALIRQAADRWESLLPQDLFSLWINDDAICGITDLAYNDLVDDLVVLVGLVDDEPGGTLASAGPCSVRVGGGEDLLPLVGVMVFDLQDLDDLESSGQLGETALHEFGHVMGFGSVWDPPDVFQLPPWIVGAGGSDPYFNGPLARQAFDDAGGTNYSGQKVPVENTGDSGTRDSHWRESVMDNELMTGYAEATPGEKLSRITLQSLQDIGWPEVDLAGADAYQLPGGGGAAVSPEQIRKRRPWGDDVLRPDLYGVGEDGERVLLWPGKAPPDVIRR